MPTNPWELEPAQRAKLADMLDGLAMQIKDGRRRARPVKRALGDLILACHERDMVTQGSIFAIVMRLLFRGQGDRLLAVLIALDVDTSQGPGFDPERN